MSIRRWIRWFARRGVGCTALWCVCVCVWLMVTISGAEISGSSIVQLTTTRKLHLISYSCIAPLHYSTDPAGMSISKLTADALNNQSSILSSGLTVWSFLITFSTDNPGACSFLYRACTQSSIQWRPHIHLFLLGEQNVTFCVAQYEVLAAYGQWLISP